MPLVVWSSSVRIASCWCIIGYEYDLLIRMDHPNRSIHAAGHGAWGLSQKTPSPSGIPDWYATVLWSSSVRIESCWSIICYDYDLLYAWIILIDQSLQLVMAVASVILTPLSTLSSFSNQGIGWKHCVPTCCQEQSLFFFLVRGTKSVEACPCFRRGGVRNAPSPCKNRVG
jgi:hypothetical protein